MTRRNDRRLALLVGGGLAFLFTIISAVQVAAWSVGETESSTQRVLSGRFEELLVESPTGDVTVLRSVDERVRIDARAEGTLHTPAPSIEIDGGRVLVAANCPVWGFGECSSDVVVHVPASTDVRVDSGSGDIVVRDLPGGGDFKTGSGDVVVDGAAGDIALESGSGDTIARGLRSRMAKAETGSGDVDLRFAVAPQAAEALTGSGDVRILVPPGREGYNVGVESGSGGTDVGVLQDDRSTRFLRAETNSGDAVVDYGG
ncbi:DUF4097 family beta strand repeat protein [Solirubrobacter sp. CPCC 204708]|uniref:DUF4097 domain-containing protein n=1 Tax=Solirubrobacter deserti TaxID=2282478 RepID=A0ABT4RT78_9ACTN|nr:DUF4097 family beta strand repeat-containing protein [Solirubrobacter deserti]MBE2318435.1 DUF4097 family beta strand repeat protein [Solirubrobacter deserti]MDA0141791.1 DUF4097 domain-containing protein [Solirubrobacter deserti]